VGSGWRKEGGPDASRKRGSDAKEKNGFVRLAAKEKAARSSLSGGPREGGYLMLTTKKGKR